MPVPNRRSASWVIDRFRTPRRLRLGLLLIWRGLSPTACQQDVRPNDPAAQRRRWDEHTAAAERFHWATRETARDPTRDARP